MHEANHEQKSRKSAAVRNAAQEAERVRALELEYGPEIKSTEDVRPGRGVQEAADLGNVDADGVQVRSTLGADGRLEYPDPVPVSAPLGYRPSPTLRDTIERIFANHQLQMMADLEGFDSPQDADDFEIEDDPLDPLTPYEAQFLPQERPEPEKPAAAAGAVASSAGDPGGDGGPSAATEVKPDASAATPPSFPADQLELFKAFSSWMAQNAVKRSES